MMMTITAMTTPPSFALFAHLRMEIDDDDAVVIHIFCVTRCVCQWRLLWLLRSVPRGLSHVTPATPIAKEVTDNSCTASVVTTTTTPSSVPSRHQSIVGDPKVPTQHFSVITEVTIPTIRQRTVSTALCCTRAATTMAGVSIGSVASCCGGLSGPSV